MIQARTLNKSKRSSQARIKLQYSSNGRWDAEDLKESIKKFLDYQSSGRSLDRLDTIKTSKKTISKKSLKRLIIESYTVLN